MMSRMILNVQQKTFSETKAHLEPSQISMIELFVDKIANKDLCKKKKKIHPRYFTCRCMATNSGSIVQNLVVS